MQATAVVPLPINGSRIIAPSFENNFRRCAMRLAGLTDRCVLYSPFSFLFGLETKNTLSILSSILSVVIMLEGKKPSPVFVSSEVFINPVPYF